MHKALLVAILGSFLWPWGVAFAENDLEDLALLANDPGISAALHQVGKVPLSSNTIGYDPCDDPVADGARKTGCAANGKIEHVIYIVLENHTFDNYFGNINASAPRVDPSVDVAKPGTNEIPQSVDSRTYRFPKQLFHLTEYCGWSDLGHGWDDIHTALDQNKLDGFLLASSTDAPVMGQFHKEDLAYYYELAKRFAVGDRFFTSAPTQSWPNHYYTVAATSGGYINNDLPIIQDDTSRLQPGIDPEKGTVKLPETGHVWRTIFDSLEEGGISWKIYMTNIAIPMAFSNFKKWAATGHVTTIAQYYADLAAGTLPQVVYLAPGINVSDEHPSSGNHQRGQLQVSTLVNSLLASTSWATSAMFILYDDSGGWYDHVPAPRAYQPNDRCEEHAASGRAEVCAATKPEDLTDGTCNCLNGTWVPASKAGYADPLTLEARFSDLDDPSGDNFDLLGARIPFTIVSPWVKSAPDSAVGYVTHHVYETVAVLSFIEWRFGLPSLNARTRAYKDGWRNPGCDWKVDKLREEAAKADASEETRALAWSAALFDPFRTVRCEPCPEATDAFCAPANPGKDSEKRAPITLALAENRYLDPLLEPFEFGKARVSLLDGVAIAAGLPPLSETDLEELAACPTIGGKELRSPLSPSKCTGGSCEDPE